MSETATDAPVCAALALIAEFRDYRLDDGERDRLDELETALRGDGPRQGAKAAKCDECGRFVRSGDLYPVWGSMPDSGPDHEACSRCRPREEA